ncbi:MAG: STAS domain-containing protein [Gemmataceae bacterium]|nr:STAS domain-containing protein [Gemmataceae bacterium]
MEITRDLVGDILVVTPQATFLDVSNTKEFKRDMSALFDTHTRVVMDLSRLEFVDSSACGVFISCLRQLKSKGGDMKLCAVTKPVRTLFELVRMQKVFDIFNTRDEAIKAFRV